MAEPVQHPAALPRCPQAERAVLGAILLEPGLLQDPAITSLGEVDFSEDRHRLIFKRIRELQSEGTVVDVRTVQARLERFGEFERIGGLTYLAQLDLDLPDLGRFSTYVGIVKEDAERRRLIQAFEGARHALLRGRDVPDAIVRVQTACAHALRQSSTGVIAHEVSDFLALETGSREVLLDGLLRRKDQAMVFGPRGIGKTYFTLELACAVSAGGSAFKWPVPNPTGVLYVDGEMCTEDLQERIAACLKARDAALLAPLRVIAADAQDWGLPNLATADGQAAMERHLEGVGLVILDNLSTLFDSGPENDAESATPLQRWQLRLRRMGFTVLLVHHAGKAGLQRGTSRREDILDLVLNLRRAPDYEPSQGCRFEVHFEKARGLTGEALQPFEASLGHDAGGRAIWTVKSVKRATAERAAELAELGLTQRQIAAELGLHQSSVSRALRRQREGESP